MTVDATNEFSCPQCNKICKSKGGLTRHTKAKHDNQEKESSVSSIKSDLKFDVLTESFNHAKGSLLTDECYPESIRMKVGTYAAPSENLYSLYKDVSPLYHEFMKSGNMEIFMQIFMAVSFRIPIPVFLVWNSH